MRPGRPLPSAYVEENLELLGEGVANLQAHLNNVKQFGVPAVVAVNVFPTDTEREIEYLRAAAAEAGAHAVAATTHWANGGQGALEMAEAVEDACTVPGDFSLLYPDELSLKEKISTIARKVYGAADVSYTALANRQLAQYEKAGFGDLPICMAKTHLSISHDPGLRGAPRGYTLPIREVRASVGPGSYTHWSAPCAPCPVCRRLRPTSMWTSTRPEKSWASSEVSRPNGGGVSGRSVSSFPTPYSREAGPTGTHLVRPTTLVKHLNRSPKAHVLPHTFAARAQLGV